MVKTEIGIIDGKKIIYCQCMTNEEVKETGGVASYWEVNGAKVINPADIQKMVIESMDNGTYALAKIITPDKLKEQQQRIVSTQKQMMVAALETQRDEYAKRGLPTQSIEIQIEQIKEYDKYLDMDGMVRKK